MYSIFDSFFAPQQVIVVSEAALKSAQQHAREKQLTALTNRINELTEYRDNLQKVYDANLLDADGKEVVHDA
tara:strand:+ start:7978 stop:8193 length:216 start_codon:yes stop_codon:yes gene_type:complete